MSSVMVWPGTDESSASPRAGEASPQSGEADTARARWIALADRFDAAAERSMALWLDHGPDRECGGFHGFLDRSWRPCGDDGKTTIQQARHLWSLAFFFERRGARPGLEEAAASTRTFLERLRGPDGEFALDARRDGAPRNPTRQLYGQSFAIYALSVHGRVHGDASARCLALDTFLAIDARAHDPERGGYLAGDDGGWFTDGAVRCTNTHIHILEALTALLDATGDERVQQRLAELVRLVGKKLRQPSGYVHPRFDADWTPHGRPRVSYGHDLETAWLLLDASRALGAPDDPSVVEDALPMGNLSAREGMDAVYGGVFDEGVPGQGVTGREKVWWAQVEALAGLYQLYRLSGDDCLLGKAERTMDWLEDAQWDRELGGYFWGVLPDGSMGPHGDLKGEHWKTPYHEVRAFVMTSDWIRDELS